MASDTVAAELRGVVRIKAQYLQESIELETPSAPAKRKADEEPQPESGEPKDDAAAPATADDDADERGSSTDRKPSKAKYQNPKHKKKLKGQNKTRPMTYSRDDLELCVDLFQGKPCLRGEKCRFTHNIQEYYAAKEKDIGPNCHLFDTFGKCPYGIKCRFAQAHTTPDLTDVVDEAKAASVPQLSDLIKNRVSKETQRLIREKTYPTPKSDEFLEWNIQAKKEKRALIDVVLERQRIVKEQQAAVVVAAGGADASDTSSQNQSDPTEPTARLAADPVPKTESGYNLDDDLGVNDTEVKIFDAALEEHRRKLARFEADFWETKLRKEERKQIDFRGKLYVAPLTTVGNLPFRRICKRFGADITCGEMALAGNLFSGQNTEWSLVRRHVSEDIFGIQVTGNQVEQIVKIAEFVENELDVDFVDINMGCPVDSVCSMGAGSQLMDRATKVGEYVRGMKHVMTKPVTVKLRMGIVDYKPTAHKLMPKLVSWGVDHVTLHGRSKQQRYTRAADWEYIGECAKLAGSSMSFFGNGDCMNQEEYYHNIEQYKVDGVLLGRGALIKPWLMTEIKERRTWDISSRERLDILRDFCSHGLEHWGSDTQGVNKTRRFLCEWMSFLCRYVPVGLLEVLPQRIGQRPPPFVGRDDLETLMGSTNAQDWVKISEMLLGPAPEDFKFVPKHKSNSYDPEAQG
ncbi:tRNA-dihydrouridine synthase 3-like protein [Polychytrium aggregatum]|uniref:tRNA-dihydrouridine synthase 3-like protein n=1 Tax=Polychytrium aggregatum TaxID=110093 RepID=UPI0022FDE5E7|nr:tRNA-dihydrouridine synthase 3-like protein [Polychytrium aggregatum]KAI9203873.1 tRNA-dihydrouridine synthase 3-like protein [Polychytrium aggregatum]